MCIQFWVKHLRGNQDYLALVTEPPVSIPEENFHAQIDVSSNIPPPSYNSLYPIFQREFQNHSIDNYLSPPTYEEARVE